MSMANSQMSKPSPRPASGFTCSVFTSAVMPETPPAAMVLIRVVFPAPLRPTCGELHVDHSLGFTT